MTYADDARTSRADYAALLHGEISSRVYVDRLKARHHVTALALRADRDIVSAAESRLKRKVWVVQRVAR